MANFVPSALLNGQARFTEAFLSKEWRLPDNAAIRMMQIGGAINPDHMALRTREDRAVHAYFPIRKANIGSVARAAAHTGARLDSIDETLTWTTIAEPFTISVKQADNNIFSFAEMFAVTQRNAVLNLIDRIDAYVVAQLIAGKTGYSAGGGLGTFNDVPDVYEVPVAEKDYFFQNAKNVMNFNLYRGSLVGILDERASMLAARLFEQGSANATNYGFQFAGAEWIKTTRTLLGSDYEGSALMFEAGGVAVLPWIPKQNRKPLDPVKAVEYNGDWGQIDVPELGFPIAIHSYAQRADNGNVGGYTQDLTIEMELSVDIGYVQAPLSTIRSAVDEVVYGFGQLKI